MITELEYCSKVCGAKCCKYFPKHYRCKHLAIDNTCKIYEERFRPKHPALEVVDFYKDLDGTIKPLYCGAVKKVIEAGQLPDEIVNQCCVANPKLLEKFKNGRRKSTPGGRKNSIKKHDETRS